MRLNLLHRFPRMYFFALAAAIGCMAVSGCNASVAEDDSSDAAAQEDGQKSAEEQKQPADNSALASDQTGKEDEKEEKLQKLELADGRLVLEVPSRWKRELPRVRIIEVELTVPPKETEGDEKGEDADACRLTIMPSGGSIEANIDRWMGQFKQPDGKSSREAAKIEKKEYDGLAVHLVDLAGTFLDRRGPFAPAQEKENHRMLAAIIETDGAGNYFVKFTGPAETVEHNAAAFWRALEELEWK